MENPKIEIIAKEGVSVVTVLHGTAEPIYHDKGLEVTDASVDAVKEYLSKKGTNNEAIVNSKIEFSYSGLFINLYYDLRRMFPDKIKGLLKLHPDLLKFSINEGKQYSTFQLADFIKMNRHYFENKETAMKLVSELRNFEGKVNKDVELKADNRANTKVLLHQTVESNIPASFYLLLPIFVGQEKVRLEVEVSINASFECSLVSPDLKQLIDEETKIIIDAELTEIREMHPDLKIFQK